MKTGNRILNMRVLGMKRLTITIPLAVLSLFSCGVRNGTGQDRSQKQIAGQNVSQFIKPEAVQGCYELGSLHWLPPLWLGEDKEFITPPPRIQILAERGVEGFEQNGYLVRPAPGVPRSIHRGSYWISTGPREIEIVWTTGFSGLSMQLTVVGEILRGKAKSFWDFPRWKQTASVVAHKVDCAERQAPRT